MKIHDSLPDGFRFADRLQEESYDACGSINGARKVALVRTETSVEVACCLRPPRTMEDVQSVGRDSTNDPAEYARLYNAGWAAGKRGSDLDLSDTAHAWDDGYLDARDGRMKWHSTWCADHDACGTF